MTTILEQASQGAATQVLGLKKRVYRVLVVPGMVLGAVMVQFGTPAQSLAWWLSMLSLLVWTLLIWAFLSGRLRLRPFEWSLFISAGLLFLGLLRLDISRNVPMFAVTVQVLYIWTFLSFGTKAGVQATVAFFAASLLVYALGGPVSESSTHLFTLFSLATPVYLACLYAFAAVLEGQASTTLAAVTELAYRDALTKLPNRLNFREHLGASLDAGQPLALLFIDLDNFKAVNDGLGHQAGDQLLCELAVRWQALLPPSDLLARISGDEFAVICPGLTLHDVPGRAALLLSALDEPFTLAGQPYRASASIGIGLYPDPALSAEELLRHADEAMYAVKASGKNGMQVYVPGLVSVRLR